MKLKIRLDICNLCQLNCRECWVRKVNYGDLRSGYVDLNTYKKFIDNNKHLIDTIEISNSGEPLLNPDIIDILKYSFENNIKITCSNGTNFNIKNKKIIEALVDYQVQKLTIAIDGVTQDVYESYRRNGNLDLVFENLEYLNNYKKIKNSNFPLITWQYIIMEKTEDPNQIIRAIELSKQYKINLRFKLTWDVKYIPKNQDEIMRLTGLPGACRHDYESNTGNLYYKDSKCRQLWRSPQINWDGRLLGCCANKHPLNINIFDFGYNGLLKGLLSDEYMKSKKVVAGELNKQFLSEQNSCRTCHNLEAIAKKGYLDKDFVNFWNKIFNDLKTEFMKDTLNVN